MTLTTKLQAAEAGSPSFEDRAKSVGFRLIDTAPRDGTMIAVTADEAPIYVMCWNQFGSNALVQAERGIWWAKGGAFTWSERHGCGPTHWAPLDHPMIAAILSASEARDD